MDRRWTDLREFCLSSLLLQRHSGHIAKFASLVFKSLPHLKRQSLLNSNLFSFQSLSVHRSLSDCWVCWMNRDYFPRDLFFIAILAFHFKNVSLTMLLLANLGLIRQLWVPRLCCFVSCYTHKADYVVPSLPFRTHFRKLSFSLCNTSTTKEQHENCSNIGLPWLLHRDVSTSLPFWS